MIYITQLIYIKEGKHQLFEEFENIALPLIPKYNGSLLLRIRPELNQIISGNIENPYEVHLIAFNSESDFEQFMMDEERKNFLFLKEQSIQSSVLIKGSRLN
jgi:uncharacterized protein (DUF1330 family)